MIDCDNLLVGQDCLVLVLDFNSVTADNEGSLADGPDSKIMFLFKMIDAVISNLKYVWVVSTARN